MSASASLVLSIFLGIVCAVTALKEGDCEGEILSDSCLYIKVSTNFYNASNLILQYASLLWTNLVRP